jgi:hypothetical protein
VLELVLGTPKERVPTTESGLNAERQAIFYPHIERRRPIMTHVANVFSERIVLPSASTP